MTKVERLTVNLAPEVAELVRAAVASGDYASASEIVGEALRAWQEQRGSAQPNDLAELRQDAEEGLSDIRAGRVVPFDAAAIIGEAKRRRSGG